MRSCLVVAFIAVVFSPPVVAQAPQQARSHGIQVRQSPLAALSGFVANDGQWDEEVLFLARRNGVEAVLTREALFLHPLPRWGQQGEEERKAGLPHLPEAVPGAPLALRFPKPVAVEGDGAGPTRHHFLLGSDFTVDVPGFERVVYRDVAPGIDLVVRSGGEGFAYDLHVEAGADLGALALEIEGVSGAELVGPGLLVLETSAGVVEHRIEASWQEDLRFGTRVPSEGRFRLLGDGVDGAGVVRLGFEAPGRDVSRPFVLDPTFAYVTYIGGTGVDSPRDMDVAPDGSVYIAARSFGGPTTPGAFQPSSGGGADAWIGKLSPDGSTIEWATYLGDTETEHVYSVDVDQDGTVVVVGNTWSPGFPATTGALQTALSGTQGKTDLFATRLLPDGSGLVWSTFYGGPDHELGSTGGLSPTGDVLIAADPFAATPPATVGAFDTVYDDDIDTMLVAISADGSQLLFQTYFSGGIRAIAFDGASDIYLGGVSNALPTTPGAFKETLAEGDPNDAFFTKMDGSGSHLLWSTYLGGNGFDYGQSVAVDSAGAVYVCGQTQSDDFPTTGALAGPDIGTNGFVAKLLPGGSGLVWSTTLLSSCCGTTASTNPMKIAVDGSGSAWVAGYSNSSGLPITEDGLPFAGGITDAHLSKLDAFGEDFRYSTYFGGSGSDSITHVALDASADPYLVLQTSSSSLPVTPGAYDPTYSGSGDIAVLKVDGIALDPWRVLGGGVAGASDIPNLAGAGALEPGTPTRLSVRGAAPSTPALLSLSFPKKSSPLSLAGPSVIPTVSFMLPFVTTEEGSLDLFFKWPDLPPGVRIDAQVRLLEAGPGGGCATNGLRMISQ